MRLTLFLFPCFLFFSFLLSPLLLPAQNIEIDTTYIESIRYPARINGGLRFRDRTVDFSTAGRETFRLENRGLAARIGGRYKAVSYTFSIPISDLGTGSNLEQGSSLGLALQFYRPKFYLLTDVRKTKGFRTLRPGMPASFRPDVELLTATLFGFHVLRHDKFSFRSAFKQKGRQLRSSGSLLLGGLVNRQVLSADSITIPLSSEGNINITKFRQHKLGIGAGYAYTYAFDEFWSITPAVFGGAEFRFIDYDLFGSQRERERFRVSPRIRARLAFGYNGRRNYAALTGIYLPSVDATDNLDTRVGNLQIELRIGRRLGKPMQGAGGVVPMD
ncbi:DUF4421 family protein [Neolewinella persica]|uniref:DUF4421 family protein n=1 Tax=Neolewinella persica TaxID=70998 RepID=UPI00036FA5B4|nr:DUF4421 family protein [Neolewinella persica]